MRLGDTWRDYLTTGIIGLLKFRKQYSAAPYAAAYARTKNRKSTADICREVLTKPVFEKLGV